MCIVSRFALTGILLAALVACGAESPSPGIDINTVHSPGLAVTPQATTESKRSTPAKSPRGNIPKQVGEVAALCADADCQAVAVTFTIDKIEVDPKCTNKYAQEFGTKPENGHFVALSVTIKTTDKFAGDLAYWSLNPHDFSTVGQDGLTESSVASVSTYSCMNESEMLPSNSYSPSSQYVGKVVLDTRNRTGVVAFRPAVMDGGWEWSF